MAESPPLPTARLEYLPQREPYSLGAQLDGYESIPDRGKEYEPRTTGIELVMKRLPTFIVRYSYGRTDAPVEPSD